MWRYFGEWVVERILIIIIIKVLNLSKVQGSKVHFSPTLLLFGFFFVLHSGLYFFSLLCTSIICIFSYFMHVTTIFKLLMCVWSSSAPSCLCPTASINSSSLLLRLRSSGTQAEQKQGRTNCSSSDLHLFRWSELDSGIDLEDSSLINTNP